MARIGGAPLPTITDDRALGAVDIQRSLRFNGGDSPKMTRTFGTNTSDTTKTISFWLKRGNLGSSGMQNIFCTTLSGYIEGRLRINTDDTLQFEDRDASSGSSDGRRTTTRVFRDTSSWYHIMLVLDSTQGTELDRAKIYINGTQDTNFSATVSISQNYSFSFMRSSAENYIGEGTNEGSQFDGYLAEINFIDGQALDSSYFGFTDSQTGIWMPKRYEGSYGNNGFYLDFSDNSSTAALGIDKSPNGNDFTTNNFSVSAGVGNDSLEDTPTNNFCTLNKLNTIKYNANYDTILEQGGLLMRGGDNVSPATMLYPKSGKWYCEFSKYGNGYSQGVSVVRADTDIRNLDGVTSHSSKVTITTYVELLVRGSSVSNNGTTWENDADVVIGVAVDMDNGAMYFAINNTWINSGVPTSGSAKTNAVATDLLTVNNGHHYVAAQGFNGNDNSGMYANFGQQAFAYTPPSGYKTLCAKNLPPEVPSIVRPKRHFDTLLYTGTGSSNIVEGLEFSPDMIWVKGRDTNGTEHAIIDSVRGGTKSLVPNSTDAESTHGGRSMTFYPGGVRWNSDSNICNANGENYVLWSWKGGGSSNTFNIDGTGYATAAAAGLDGGTIDPTGASINTEAGFSITTYTGNGTAGATVAHGLGKKPAWIIIKARDVGDKWFVYHHRAADIAGAADGHVYAELQETAAFINYPNMLNDTAPTDTLVTLHSDRAVNGDGNTYVMYSWTEIPGYSKFGSYVGNGSANGPFVYLGFRPAFVLFKKSDTNGYYWEIRDNKRDSFNPSEKRIFPNTSDQENSSESMDFLSNGFKLKHSQNGGNASGGTYVYMAFAEEPGTTPFDTFPNAR